jgi:hypothetical protein
MRLNYKYTMLCIKIARGFILLQTIPQYAILMEGEAA